MRTLKKINKSGRLSELFFLDYTDNISFSRNLLMGLDLSDVCYTCTP